MEVLSYGSKGVNVNWLQRTLNKDGFNLTTDGVFGKGTLAAVKEFQKRYNLTSDGEVGPYTQKKLQQVEKRRFTRVYYDKQTTYFVYPKEDIAKIDIINSKGKSQWSLETVVSMQHWSCMDTVSNGGMYDMKTGATCHYFVDEGVQIGYNAYDPFALLIMKDGTIKFWDVSSPVKNVKDGIGFSPSLIINGEKKSTNKNLTKAYIFGHEPRHAFMETKNYYVEVFVNGRQPLKGWMGCSIPNLVEICFNIGKKIDGPSGGCINAGNLDGGGSCSMAIDGVEVIKNTSSMRYVDNGLGILMKK